MLLRGIRVIEFAGLAPGPFCGKILSDYGAQVIKIDKLQPNPMFSNFLNANKKSICLNLKKKSAVNIVKKMSQSYDVLIDPYRPGVLEKMGLGPEDVMEKNPRLIYARLSGYGQTGPLSKEAGHDINYVALSGILSLLGRKENVPTPPINLLADFAGGGLLCAFGIVLALYDRANTGKGQVIDLSMAEGTAYVGSWLYSTKNSILFDKPRGENWLDSGAHFYDTYETKDGQYMSVGSIEPQFFNQLLIGLGIDEDEVSHTSDFEKNHEILARKFKEKTREEWSQIFGQLDACVLPVLSLDEAPKHPHNIARKNFRKVANQWEPNPAPRLTDSRGVLNPVLEETQRDASSLPESGDHTVDILKELGYSDTDIKDLIQEYVLSGDVKSKL